MRDIILVTAVLICAAHALRRPAFGILAFVCFSTLNPHSYTWGFARELPFAMIMALATIIGYVVWNEPRRFPKQREFYVLLVLWLIFFLSCFSAIQPDDAWTQFEQVSKILLMVFLSMSLINTRRRFHLLFRIIALSIGFYGLKSGLWFISTGGGQQVFGPELSFLASNNAIGLAMAMNAPLLFYLAKVEKNQWLRRLMWAMLVFSYASVIGTFSRGAWVGLAAATALFVLKSKYRVPLMAGGLALSIMALPLIVAYAPERVTNRFEDLVNYESESSAQSRFWNWTVATKVALGNPITGGGFDYYSIQVYEEYYPEFLERWPGKLWSCHSAWFTVMSEHGFPALFLWIFMLISSMLSLRRLRNYGRESPDREWLCHYSNMLSVSLVVYMVVGTFYDAAYFDVFFQIIAGVIILKEGVQRGTFENEPEIAESDKRSGAKRFRLASGLPRRRSFKHGQKPIKAG